MQIPPNINFSVCPPNSSSQIPQNHTPAFGYNQLYPNMPYINQPLQPSPPYYQQSFQPSQHCYQQPLRHSPYHAEQTLGGTNASHHNTKVSTGGSERLSKRKWTKEEDLQLTIAYVRVSTDPAVGVGQTRLRLWERVRMMFTTLMSEKHGHTTESNARTHASRERALATTVSGWSTYDIEKHCHYLYEEDGSGSFKCEECWDVLKQCPNWQESKPKNSIKAKRPFPNTDSHIEENASQSKTSNTVNIQSPSSPVIESIHSRPNVGVHGKSSTCTPDLDGPASEDMKRLPRMKKTKVNNQRQKNIRKHSECQTSASQSITKGFMRVEEVTNSWRSKQDEKEHMRLMMDNERYKKELAMQVREHDLRVAKERTDITERLDATGEKLVAALQKLDEIDPRCVANANHLMMLECQKKAVENWRRKYKELEETLERTKFSSPIHAPVENNISNGKISQRRLFDDQNEPIHLDEDD